MVNERGSILLGPQPEQADQKKRFMLQQDGTTREILAEDLWQHLPDAMTVTSTNEEQEGEQ